MVTLGYRLISYVGDNGEPTPGVLIGDHVYAPHQLLTATPLREDNRDTYLYFGNPLYQYSLRQGIDDGVSGGLWCGRTT